MKIYTVKPDTDFRFIYPEDSVYRSEDWEFKCKPLAGVLPLNFQAYFQESDSDPIPDIAWLGMSTFAFKDEVAEYLLDILEDCGELLPFTVNGQTWYCLNVLQKADDALDTEKSEYKYNEGGIKFGLKNIALNADKLPASGLFKIKGDNYTTTFCIDDQSTDEGVLGSFFCAVASGKFTGVKFEEVPLA
ncbi:hypothetical protein [Thalassolituus oleivorans]|uniref:hypothetical protein n=1 Tax=Thalassolituus oleivorans TaxID=187493 RepID=UPI0023F4E0EE|nr:hypothetical protein [Thalassolituus oleivorans]